MKGKILISVALAAAVTLGGCASDNGVHTATDVYGEISDVQTNEIEENTAGQETSDSTEEQGEIQTENNQTENSQTENQEEDNAENSQIGQQEQPQSNEEQQETGESAQTEGNENGITEETEEKEAEENEEASAAYSAYIKVTGTGVNIRAGAGTSYASLGVAEQNTLYACLGQSGGWYKTMYCSQTAYISATYCEIVEIEQSADELVENVIAEGLKLLGVKYVYGAVRYHDGTGKLYSGFTNTQFDCSSLTQYIFYKGAGVLLQVNTRTQIYQGEHVEKSDLQRGDLMFFTNDSRYYNTGIERVGHVAVYLGDNYILHTSSDYAKIEQLTTKRWNYFLEARRVL